MGELELLQRRFERERNARKQAESLLEQKSREVFQANEELRSLASRFKEQADRTQAIVDTAAEGIVTFSEQGIIESFNPAAQRIFDYPVEKAAGMTIEALIFPRTNELADEDPQSYFETLQAKAEDHDYEFLGRREDGSEFPLDLAISDVVLGERRLFIALIRDLTKRRQLETQLFHAQKMESVGQLAAGIAHEINTPIQYVGDNARFLDDTFQDLDQLIEAYQQLLTACETDALTKNMIAKTKQLADQADIEFIREEVPQAIQQSLEGAERVATIVRAMKEFSHPGGIDKQPTDLNHMIEGTITVSRSEWKFAAEIKTDLAESLPPVPCSPGELGQALLNLVVNAAHAIEAGQEQEAHELGQISISTRQVGDFVEIRVSDTGTGIPEAARSKIFDPFFTTKDIGKGTGQGLAITHAVIVENHGGTIELETEVGQGTTFILGLPLTV